MTDWPSDVFQATDAISRPCASESTGLVPEGIDTKNPDPKIGGCVGDRGEGWSENRAFMTRWLWSKGCFALFSRLTSELRLEDKRKRPPPPQKWNDKRKKLEEKRKRPWVMNTSDPTRKSSERTENQGEEIAKEVTQEKFPEVRDTRQAARWEDHPESRRLRVRTVPTPWQQRHRQEGNRTVP